MGHALKISEPRDNASSKDAGRKATEGYIHAVASELRRIFQSDDAFKRWEVDAIVGAVTSELRVRGKLSRDPLYVALHRNGLPKELSGTLAEVLSR